MGKNSFLKNLGIFCNPYKIYGYHKRCIENFGLKFISMLFTTYFIVNGLLTETVTSSQLPFYIFHKYNSQDYQLNMNLSRISSALKGFLGVISDVYPIFGYYKTPYMYITSFLAFISIFLLIVLPPKALFSFKELPALFFFMFYIEEFAHDLYCQGKFAEKMSQKPNSKADLVTFSMFYQTFGKLFPSIYVGLWADNLNINSIFFLVLPLTISPVLPLWYGCMVDDSATQDKNNKLDFEKIQKYGKPMILGCLITILAVGMILMSILTSPLARALYGVTASVFLGGLTFFSLPYIIAKANLYIFLCDLVYFDIRGPMQYWFLAEEDCVPGGPNFDYSFYLTVSGTFKILAQCMGIILFQIILCHWKIRTIYWSTTLLRVIASLSDIFIVLRWNKAIGIPDQVFFLLGNTIMFQTLFMMDLMPSNFLIARLCPPKLEACIFAIIAGYANFALSVAEILGIYFQDFLNVYGSAEQGCNYKNFVLLIFISSIIGPCINVLNTFWMVPNIRLTDNFVKEVFNKEKKIVIKKDDWQEVNL